MAFQMVVSQTCNKVSPSYYCMLMPGFERSIIRNTYPAGRISLMTLEYLMVQLSRHLTPAGLPFCSIKFLDLLWTGRLCILGTRLVPTQIPSNLHGILPTHCLFWVSGAIPISGSLSAPRLVSCERPRLSYLVRRVKTRVYP